MDKRGDAFQFTNKHLIMWLLIGVFVIVIWFIINGIIKKLLTI